MTIVRRHKRKKKKGYTKVRKHRRKAKKKMPTIYSLQEEEEFIYPSEKPYDKWGDSRRSGRDTGWFGTGFYGFANKDNAGESPLTENRRMVEMEIDKPFTIEGGFNEGLDIHDASRDIWRLNPKTRKVEGRWSESSPQSIIDAFEVQGITDLTVDELIEAKKESKKLNKQPINIILEKRGFDGLIPPKSMDNSTYGAVKFGNKKMKFNELDSDPTT